VRTSRDDLNVHGDGTDEMEIPGFVQG